MSLEASLLESQVNYKLVHIGYIQEHEACGRLHIPNVRFNLTFVMCNREKYKNEKKRPISSPSKA